MVRSRVHTWVLVAFAALAGLFEGPAEIACVAAIVTTIAIGGFARYRPGVVEIGLLVWAMAGIPGTLDAESSNTGAGALRPLLALAFLVGARAVARGQDTLLERMAWAFAGACALNGAYGYLQVFMADPPLEALIIGNTRSEHLVDPDNRERLRMATGLFYNRLKLAHVGVVGLGLLGLVAARRESAARTRALAVAAGLVLAGAIFLTYRRAAPAALLVGLLVLAVVAARFRLALAAVAVALVIAGAYVLSAYGRQRLETSGLHFAERLDIYDNAWKLFLQHPVLGVGHGDYQAAITRVAPGMQRDLTTSPHSLGLHVLVETGLVGVVAFVTAIAASIVRLGRRVRRDRHLTIPLALLDRFALLGVVTVLALGLVHSVLYHAPVALIFWCLVGVAACRRPATAA